MKSFSSWLNERMGKTHRPLRSEGGRPPSPIAALVAFLLLGTALAHLTSCSSVSRRAGESEPPTEATPNQTPTESWPSTPSPETTGPALKLPAPAPQPKLGIILGPGGYRTMAHVGVLKAFHKAKIPIAAIVGLEWGALVGAIYAQTGMIHELEWKLYKLDKNSLPSRGFFSGRTEPEPISKLQAFVTTNIPTPLDRMKIPFSCPTLSLQNGSLIWQERGAAKDVLSHCLPFPPIYRPVGQWAAASSAVTEAAQRLRRKGVELVVFVNVAGDPKIFEKSPDSFATHLLWQQTRHTLSWAAADRQNIQEVIDLRLPQAITNFDNGRQAVALGEKAGTTAALRLTKKYGY